MASFVSDPAIQHRDWSLRFLADAGSAATDEDHLRYLGSAVEQAVAVVEWTLGQVPGGWVDDDWKGRVRQLAADVLPHYRLLKRVRIHNFHRRPLPQAQKGFHTVYMQGPIRLTTGNTPGSSVSVSLSLTGEPVYRTTGSGSVDRRVGGSETELWVQDGKILDEDVSSRVDLEEALSRYLDKVPEFLARADSLRVQKR